MKLRYAIDQYVAFQRSLGGFCYNRHVLSFFCRTIGENISIGAVRQPAVRRFLAGTGPLTRNWHRKYSALRGFYRFAVSRGHVASSPLPTVVPKEPASLTPYIYSREELQRLLDATAFNATTFNHRHLIEPVTLRTMLLVLYGAGLRPSEVLRLNIGDVDLTEGVLTVRLSKFYKSRLVPVGKQLVRILKEYLNWRKATRHHHLDSDQPYFMGRTGQRVPILVLQNTFRRLCNHAGIHRSDGGRYQPRLHDLRHTFAVHRLIAWYRQGANVQDLLPHLSVYLGHVYLAATQVYLTMTPELLQEASHRFERYVGKEVAND